MKTAWLIFVLGCFLALPSAAQKDRKHIREGNKAFEQNNFANAEVEYSKAREETRDPVIPDFNLGDALYKQKKYDKATNNFLSVTGRTQDDLTRANAYYNLGNSLLQAKKLDESIEAYKNALKYNPDDLDAKYNLLYAMHLRKQQKQQKNQKQNQKQQDKNKQNQQNKQSQQQQQKQQQQQQQQKQEQSQQQKSQPQKGKISKQDAERLLQALANDEKKVQEKVKRARAKRENVKSVINW